MKYVVSRNYSAWEKKVIYFGIFFIGVMSSLIHFLYDFSGKIKLFAVISPTNESVWEHLKLAFLPTLIWWIISYFLFAKKNNVSCNKWFVGTVIAIIIPQIFVMIFYYTYTGAFGFESMVLDILSLFIGIIIAQFIAMNYCKEKDYKDWHFYLAIIIFVALFASYIIFTFNPPHIPLFYDKSKGVYGLT